jgi:hypothetical protein
VLTRNPADDDKSRFILDPRRDLQQIRVFPKSLHVIEVDAVLGEVSHAFLWVELESHNGIENIPFWEQNKAPIWRQSTEIQLLKQLLSFSRLPKKAVRCKIAVLTLSRCR